MGGRIFRLYFTGIQVVILLAGIGCAYRDPPIPKDVRYSAFLFGAPGEAQEVQGQLLRALSINNRGVCVGWMGTERGGVREPVWAFQFTPPDLWMQLGQDDDPRVRWMAFAITDEGWVLGNRRDQQGRMAGFLWRNGEVEFLDTGDREECAALAINSHGVIVGRLGSADDDDHVAVMWLEGEPIALGTVPGTTTSEATAINDNNVVVGRSGDLPFTWQDGELEAWGKGEEFRHLHPTSINGFGDACATYTQSNPRQSAMLWKNGTLVPLRDPVSGIRFDIGSAITDEGIVVGAGRTPLRDAVACLRKENGEIVMVEQLVNLEPNVRLITASYINKRGFICGTAAKGDHFRGYILSPIAKED